MIIQFSQRTTARDYNSIIFFHDKETLQSKYNIFLQKWTRSWERKFIEVFLLRELWFSLSIYLRFSLRSCWFRVSLPKEVQRKDLSSRHSNAAHVSENIRLQRRAAIFVASVIDAIFPARPQRSNFSPQNRVLHEKVELLLLLHARSWRNVRCVGFSKELAKFSFIRKVWRLCVLVQWERTVQANASSALIPHYLNVF